MAIVGSRDAAKVDIGKYLDGTPSVIVSGGARGIDTQAAQYVVQNGIPLVEHRPDYARYGRSAPIRRNDIIVADCDIVLAFWDGRSRGTKYTIDFARRHGKEVVVVHI